MFLTYDTTREETFVNLPQWLREVRQHATEDVVMYLVGNKAELVKEREVSAAKAEDMAAKH